jgi:hypothetical protein
MMPYDQARINPTRRGPAPRRPSPPASLPHPSGRAANRAPTPASCGYRVNRKLAVCVVPSVNCTVSVRQLLPQLRSVFQT